jgi:hypothetical protein
MRKLETVEKISVVLLLFGVFVISCSVLMGAKGYRGNKELQSQERTVDEFHGVIASGSENVFVTQGPVQKLKIEAEAYVLEKLVTEVRDGVLYFKYPRYFDYEGPVNVYVTMKAIDELKISGSGNIKGQSKITVSAMDLGISGSGNIVLELEADRINTGISGAGNVTLSGKTTDHKIKVSGSGDIRALDLATTNCTIGISGSGNARVNVSSKLDVRISGSGDVQYKGSPGEVNVSGGGSGSVKKLRGAE